MARTRRSTARARRKPRSSRQPSELRREREFVTITIHELKAPLSAARWSLEFLRAGKAGPITSEQHELLEELYHGTFRLLTLVRDLLNLAKLQQGTFAIRVRPTKFDRLVSRTVQSFQPVAREKGVRLELVEPLSPVSVKLDPVRIEQVLANLLSNSIKYTPAKGQVQIGVQVVGPSELRVLQSGAHSPVHAHKARQWVVCWVKDTGFGMSRADQQRLFTRFFRSKDVLATQIEGTGLGLYITKTILELHQGKIWFRSTKGKGSTFYFGLPLS